MRPGGNDPAGRHAADLAVDTVAAVVATGAGVATGGVEGAFVGAGVAPAFSVGLRSLAARITAWRGARAGETFRAAAALAGCSEDELAEWLASDERVAEVAGRVLLIAQDAAIEQKRRALAAVLAELHSEPTGADAACDRALILANALERLGAPHVRILAALEGTRPLPADWNSERDGADFGITAEVVERRDSALIGIAGPGIHTLIAAGLVEDASPGLPTVPRLVSYALSPIGEHVLRLLRT